MQIQDRIVSDRGSFAKIIGQFKFLFDDLPKRRKVVVKDYKLKNLTLLWVSKYKSIDSFQGTLFAETSSKEELKIKFSWQYQKEKRRRQRIHKRVQLPILTCYPLLCSNIICTYTCVHIYFYNCKYSRRNRCSGHKQVAK